MLEWIVNGEVRVSTILRLISSYWEWIGACLLLLAVFASSAIKRLKKES